jgi:hypothetical protein
MKRGNSFVVLSSGELINTEIRVKAASFNTGQKSLSLHTNTYPTKSYFLDHSSATVLLKTSLNAQ